MSLFDQFPYTNFHELNLMWILEALKEIQTTTEQFVAINSLKYADPIQWNITSQYEKNTIVIDPQTGTAYISVQPVPTGVALTNSDYWTVVFDLGSFVTRAAKNFTTRWEEDTTLTATFNSVAGDWLVWGDTLYRATVDITAGDSYVVDGNIKRITMEEIKNEIYTAFNSIIGDLDELTTSDKSNLVAAINEVASEVLGKIGDLDELSTSDKSNLVAAINEVITVFNNMIGDLDDLNTYDKDTIVSAINSVFKTSQDIFINVKDFGATGDGVTDDTAAINYALLNGVGKTVYFPSGTYLFNNPLYVFSNTHVILENNATLLFDINSPSAQGRIAFIDNNTSSSEYNGQHNIIFEGGTIDHGFSSDYGIDESRGVCIALWHCKNILIRNVNMCHTYNEHCIELNSSKNVIIENCHFYDCYSYSDVSTKEAINIDWATQYNPAYPPSYDNTANENVWIEKCTFDNVINGIGAHPNPAIIDYTTIAKHKNINVIDCVFNSIVGRVFDVALWQFSIIKNCIFNDINITATASVIEIYHSYNIQILQCTFDNCTADNIIIMHFQVGSGNTYVNYFGIIENCNFDTCTTRNCTISLRNVWRAYVRQCIFNNVKNAYNMIATQISGDIFILDNVLHDCFTDNANENFVRVNETCYYLQTRNNRSDGSVYLYDITGANQSIVKGDLECLINNM